MHATYLILFVDFSQSSTEFITILTHVAGSGESLYRRYVIAVESIFRTVLATLEVALERRILLDIDVAINTLTPHSSSDSQAAS